MRIIGIIVVVLVLLSAGTCAIRNRGDDGPNTRTATVNVAQAANEPFDNAALKQSLKDNKVNDEDARKIAASAVEANTVRGQSKTVIVSALDKLSNDADTAEVIKTLDNLGKAAQAPTTPTPKPEDKSTPTPGTTPAAGKALTDAEVRTIVQDEAKKNPSLTQDQVQKLINDAIANNKSAGGLTEAQVKNIVSETIKNMPTGLTEAQIRQIAADEARKNNPGITQDQIQTMINKAVADAVAASQKAGGLSEVQVRNIINEALRNYSPNPGGVPGAGGATPTPQTGGQPYVNGTRTRGDVTNCLTTGEAQRRIGLNVVRLKEEDCTWTWRSLPDAYVAICPADFFCTMHEDAASGKVVVQVGHEQKVSQVGTTFRYVPGFNSNDDVHAGVCALYPKEVKNGLEERPSFPVFYRQTLPSDPVTCPSAQTVGPRSDSNLSVTAQSTGNTSSDNVTLTVNEVSGWCKPSCGHALSQLVESNGKVNPAGVKLQPNIGCFTFTIPANITYDGWTSSRAGMSGQTPGTFSLCEASFRKAGTD